jgi:ABC-2 type transport system ATP-binding protein
VQHTLQVDGRLELLAADGATLLPALFERAADRGVAIRSVTIHRPDLESVFLHLTGRALRD